MLRDSHYQQFFCCMRVHVICFFIQRKLSYCYIYHNNFDMNTTCICDAYSEIQIMREASCALPKQDKATWCKQQAAITEWHKESVPRQYFFLFSVLYYITINSWWTGWITETISLRITSGMLSPCGRRPSQDQGISGRGNHLLWVCLNNTG